MAGEKLGSGARFRGLAAKLAANPNVRNPNALAAYMGRQKYGTKRFQQLAKKGRERAEHDAPRLAPPRVRL